MPGQQPPGQLPPFQPYRANPDAEPKENAIAFLEWVGDALWRIHALSEMNLRYSRAMYESVVRAASAAPGRVASPAVRARGPLRVDPIVADIARAAFQNREAIAGFLKLFLK